MCGIAGRIDCSGRQGPPSRELLESMINALWHRGPDEFGSYRDERAGMASARLSIVDLSTGQQPLSNEDETLWIVFNGEIFNYVELRSELEVAGHRFRTHSDTEVIVHAFEQWGNGCFPRMNGQWAVALWDTRARRLTLARDPIGIVPLYVRTADGMVWFASEVKAIFADSSVPRRIDPRGLDQVFTYWTSLAPITLFEGIEELLPGSVRTYEADGRSSQELHWQPSYEVNSTLSLGEATEELRMLLERATALRMLRADVPVGSYLSGGIDSSLTAWMGRKVKQGEFRTFSIRFEDAEYDETRFQRMMASTLDSAHEEVLVTRKDIARVFPDVIRHTERPILRTAPAPLFCLSQLVRQAGIKAVLTGEGADEMLAGYDIFREAKIRAFWARQPESKVRPLLFDRIYPYLARSPQHARGMALQFWKRGLDRAGRPGFSHEPRWFTTSQLKKFYAQDVRSSLGSAPASDPLASLPAEFGSWDELGQAQYLEVATLLSGYLISSQGDRMLMAHSVEGRFPFLDPDVMAFCNSLPPEYKLSGLNEKFILKKVARGTIPGEIVNRQKQPYRAPDAISFVEPGAPGYVDEVLSERALHEAGIFDPASARALYEKCLQRARKGGDEALFSNTDNMALVGIISTQLLVDQFIRQGTPPPAQRLQFTTVIDRTVSDRTVSDRTVSDRTVPDRTVEETNYQGKA